MAGDAGADAGSRGLSAREVSVAEMRAECHAIVVRLGDGAVAGALAALRECDAADAHAAYAAALATPRTPEEWEARAAEAEADIAAGRTYTPEEVAAYLEGVAEGREGRSRPRAT